MVEYRKWPPRNVHHSMQPLPQLQSQQMPLMHAHLRPIAPSQPVHEPHPPLPQYHPQQMPANFWELLNRQNQNQH
jgi:hypothetical protein